MSGDAEALLAAARELGNGRRRALLGIAGPPGAGKSTLAAWLVDRLAPGAALFPMDGFHLANSELERLGRKDRKGAPDTFDVDGLVAALERVRQSWLNGGRDVYIPEFRRGHVNEPIAGALRIPDDARLVVVEGNYLLLEEGGWAAVGRLLDQCWYVDAAAGVRLPRLVERQLDKGRTPAEAHAWATGSDERNARLVATTRGRAARVIPGTLRL